MKLQTSFFNRAIYRNLLKRFAFIGVIYGLLTLIITNIGILPNGTFDRAYNNYSSGGLDVLAVMWPNPWDIFAVFFVPVVLGLSLFRFVQEEKALTAMHAFPVSRKSLFGSHVLAFASIFGLPMLGNAILSFGIIMVKGVPVQVAAKALVYYIGVMSCAALFTFFFTVMVGMLVGSSVLQGILTYTLMIMPLALVELMRVLVKWIVIGYDSVMDETSLHYLLTPYYTIGRLFFDRYDTLQFRNFITVVLMALVSGIAAYILYQKRALEKHHDFVAFFWAKKVLVAIFTALATLSLAVFIGSVMGDDPTGAYIGLVAGAFIGYGITKMVTEKTIQVWPYYRQWIGVVAGCFLALLLLDMDLVGYEDRIPDLSDVAEVYYSDDNNNYYRSYIDSSTLNMLELTDEVVMTTQEGIDLVRALHGSLIAKAKSYDNRSAYKPITIRYILDNGKVMERSYAQYDEVTFIKKLHESQSYMDFLTKQNEILFFETYSPNVTINNYQGASYEILQDERRSLVDSYNMDLRNMSYFESISSDSYGSIEVSYVYDRKVDRNSSYENRRYVSLPLFPSFENTRRWLMDHEYENLIIKVEDFNKARIYDPSFISYQDDVAVEDDSESKIWPGEDSTGIAVEDPDMLERLFNLKPDYESEVEDGYIIEFYGENYRNYRFRVQNLPGEFEPYIIMTDYYY